MSDLVKVCKVHGNLSEENIVKERAKNRKSEFSLKCRLCKREKDSRWREANREKHNASAGRARKEDRSKANEWARKDRESDPEKYRNWSREYKKQNREYINAQQRERRKMNIISYKQKESEYRNKNRQSIRENHSARKYGMTIEQYKEFIINHNNLCSICFKEETRKTRDGETTSTLCVDHCHDTGRVRGLVCHNCNNGLGRFFDSIELLQSAIDYLKKHQVEAA